MKKYCILLFIFCNTVHLFAQNSGDWISFEDEKTDLTGYKDLQGNVKIKPKFGFIRSAVVFKNIISVMEDTSSSGTTSYRSYYLLKNGKEVGEDSLYVWDYILDCEQEGKIRFRDPVTDKVGFFNKDGKITIPAIYNDAQPFYNGLALTIKDAKKTCWEGGEYSKENQCEHWRWIGNTQLINANNEVLLENLDINKVYILDWYSLKINQSNLDDTYTNFKSQNGNTYSFIDLNKQFKQWFYKEFLPKNGTEQLAGEFFETVTFREQKPWKYKKTDQADLGEWIHLSGKEFFSRNQKKIYEILNKTNNNLYDISLGDETSPYTLSYEYYKPYFTDCGEYNFQKYPYFVMDIVMKDSYQVVNSFGFIRTAEGKYKLVAVD